jgi:prevent-host-death family protein
MNAVTANELKTRGVSVVEDRLKTEEEVIISVRGQNKYVILSLETYARLREYELDMALQEARAEYKAGSVISESVEDHMKRVTDAL